MQVLLSKWGNSLGLRLPKALTAEIGVSDGQKVEVRAENGRIIVEPVRSPLTWAKMLENTSPDELRKAWDWGEDMGVNGSMTDYAPDAGDVIWTDFNPRMGREQGGRRPALVVSSRDFYDGTRFTIVCPITSRIRPFGSSVVLPADSPIAGEILVAQMRSLDALACPILFSGVKIDLNLLSAVRRKIAFLCGVSGRDPSAE